MTFETVPFPSNTNEAYRKANDARKADIDNFRALPAAERLTIDEEDENE